LATTILIGYRGTGKSTVAKLVAQRLSQPAYDSDAAVEEEVGKTIKQVFEDDGEPYFRDLEVAAINQLSSLPNVVVALGGGAVMRPENRDAIAEATVFWLKARPETIYQRIAFDSKTTEQRPNLTAFGGLAEIKALLATREPVYEACSSFIVDTEGKTADQVADEIVCLLEKHTV
jgi:shikimate kinase